MRHFLNGILFAVFLSFFFCSLVRARDLPMQIAVRPICLSAAGFIFG